MGINLIKGEQINLEKESNLNRIRIGLGWTVRAGGVDFDLDAACFLLNKEGKVSRETDFIFYNNLCSDCGSVLHKGDNLVGGNGVNDDEQIVVDLIDLPKRVSRIAVVINIYKAKERKQNFGQISSAYVRIVNNENDEELVRYELAEDYSSRTGLIFAELEKRDGWNFKTIGTPFEGDFSSVFPMYGL